jgi:hypothetical protein
MEKRVVKQEGRIGKIGGDVAPRSLFVTVQGVRRSPQIVIRSRRRSRRANTPVIVRRLRRAVQGVAHPPFRRHALNGYHPYPPSPTAINYSEAFRTLRLRTGPRTCGIVTAGRFTRHGARFFQESLQTRDAIRSGMKISFPISRGAAPVVSELASRMAGIVAHGGNRGDGADLCEIRQAGGTPALPVFSKESTMTRGVIR